MKAKHNILYLTTGSFIAGADRSLIELLDKMDRNMFMPFVLIPPKGSMFEQLEPQGTELGGLFASVSAVGVEVIPIECTRLRARSLPGFLRTVLHIAQVVHKYHIDLIHSNDYMPNQYAVFAAKLTHTPILAHVRLLLGQRAVSRTFLRLSSCVIANSAAVADRLLACGISPGRLQVVHNGVDLHQYKFSLDRRRHFRSKWEINKETFLVGIFGRICKKKGQDIAIRAFSKTVKICPDMKLIVCGSTFVDNSSGYFQELLHMIKNLGLEHQVIFTGFLEDPIDAFSGIDLLILSSEEESFSRVLIEAMATERPVIATECGGPVEIVDNHITGRLVPPNDVDAMASAMVDMATKKTMAINMGKNGREEVRKRFMSQKMARNTEQVYREFLE